jgi:hypothetical protein
MTDKAPRIKDRKTQKYSFDFKDKELNYEIQEPTFDQIKASLDQVKSSGSMDVIGAGKVIWELCCVALDTEIEKNSKVLMSICINLANEYALPVDLEIKKK